MLQWCAVHPLKPQHLSVPFNGSFVFVFVIVSGNYCCAIVPLFHAICTTAEGDSLKVFFFFFSFLGEKQKAVMKCLFLGMMCLPSTLFCGANPRHFNVHKQRGRTLTVDLEDKPLIAQIYLAMPKHMLMFWAESLFNVHLAAGL